MDPFLLTCKSRAILSQITCANSRISKTSKTPSGRQVYVHFDAKTHSWKITNSQNESQAPTRFEASADQRAPSVAPFISGSIATAVTPAAGVPEARLDVRPTGVPSGNSRLLTTESLFNDLMQEVPSKGVAGDMIV